LKTHKVIKKELSRKSRSFFVLCPRSEVVGLQKGISGLSFGSSDCLKTTQRSHYSGVLFITLLVLDLPLWQSD